MTLAPRIKARAQRQIEAAKAWWSEHRQAAPRAVQIDLAHAIQMLCEQPGVGTIIENRIDESVRRMYLPRLKYFVYYRVRGESLEVLAFWHASRDQPPRL